MIGADKTGSHCKAFAPTWEKLARENAHWERMAGFHMAQVDCLAQGGELATSDRHARSLPMVR